MTSVAVSAITSANRFSGLGSRSIRMVIAICRRRATAVAEPSKASTTISATENTVAYTSGPFMSPVIGPPDSSSSSDRDASGRR